MKRFPDILLMFIAVGTILCFSLTATGLLNTKKTKNTLPTAFIPSAELLQSGDLIFRDGKSFISKSLQQFNRSDSRFSHAGIIHKENGVAYVMHCVGGEGVKDNRMKKELLLDFCSPRNIFSYAIYRPQLDNSKLSSMDSIALVYYSKGLEFDTHFDLETSDKMYCTEFIYKIYQSVLKEKNFIPLTQVSGVKYVSCDNIFLQPQMKELFSYSYKSSVNKSQHEKSLF